MERFSLAINRMVVSVAGFALVFLMFLTVADVFGRYVLNRPVSGTFELTEMVMVLIVFLALGQAQHHGDHIALDLAYNFFPAWLKRAVDVIINLINLTVVVVITWQLYRFSIRMLEGSYTTAVLQLPVHPFVLVAVAGVATYALALVTDFGKSMKKLGRE